MKFNIHLTWSLRGNAVSQSATIVFPRFRPKQSEERRGCGCCAPLCMCVCIISFFASYFWFAPRGVLCTELKYKKRLAIVCRCGVYKMLFTQPRGTESTTFGRLQSRIKCKDAVKRSQIKGIRSPLFVSIDLVMFQLS